MGKGKNDIQVKGQKKPHSASQDIGGKKQKYRLGDVFNVKTMDPQARKILEVNVLMHKRNKARDNNDFSKSDSLREQLTNLGVEVIDQKGGPSV